MDRQTLRDAVVRYNAKGLEGLHDRGYSPRRLTADEEAALAAVIIAGPEPERDGVCAWTRPLCRWLEERARQDLPPLEHPGSPGYFPARRRASAEGAEAREQKRGLRDILKAPPRRIPTSARCGRMKRASAPGCVTVVAQGRACPRDLRRLSAAYIFSAVRPARRRDPGDAERPCQGHATVSGRADTLNQDAHAVNCDGAGWPDERDIVTETISLALLPLRLNSTP